MSFASLPAAVSQEFISSKDGEKSSRTFCQKLKYILTHITVEPLIFLTIVPSMMNQLTTQNLNLEKACRVNLQYNSSVCDAMISRDSSGYEPIQEAEVQKLVAKMVAIKMAVIGSYPVFLMLFIGSWSDRHSRRKPLILMPILGDLVSSICLFVCAYYLLKFSVEYSMLSETIPFALGGTYACAYMGIYTYVSGLCSDQDRTVRIGAVVMVQNISITLGIFASGIMINFLGFKGVYLLSTCMMSVALIYGCLKINENKIAKNGMKEAENSIREFFSIKHVKSTFRVCFKEGPGNRRSRVLVYMFLCLMIMGPLYGELAVVYLYVRIKCGWNEIDYSMYNSLHSAIQALGSIFALSFFSKYLRCDDAMLGIIAMISKICACCAFAFAPSGLFFYLGAFIEVFHGTCHIALRSLMAKIVPPHELGQANSVFGIFEAITPLLFGPLYTTLYNATILIFPGSFYIFSAGLYMITMYLFFWTYRANKRDSRLGLEMEKQKAQEEKLLTGQKDEVTKSIENLVTNNDAKGDQ